MKHVMKKRLMIDEMAQWNASKFVDIDQGIYFWIVSTSTNILFLKSIFST